MQSTEQETKEIYGNSCNTGSYRFAFSNVALIRQ
jgi:hypothetical protein